MTMNGSEWHITRLAIGLSNADLAKRVKRGARTIASYERREFDPSPETEAAINTEFDAMLNKLEPIMALRAGTAKTFWLYRTTEELHEAEPEEYSTWNIDMYRQYIAHAITILKLKGINYRIISPKHDR